MTAETGLASKGPFEGELYHNHLITFVLCSPAFN